MHASDGLLKSHCLEPLFSGISLFSFFLDRGLFIEAPVFDISKQAFFLKLAF